MQVMRLWIAVVGIMGVSTALAQTTGLQLATSKACMACHQVDTKRVGPPLKSVAQRYAGSGQDMVDYLADKIRNGGRGAWGAVPMPAQTQVNAEEARALAEWVLSLAADKKE